MKLLTLLLRYIITASAKIGLVVEQLSLFFRRPPFFGVRLLVSGLICILGTAAFAGDYELVSISGGTLYSPSQGTIPMSGTPDSYGGTLITNNETATVQGTITAVFQWNDATEAPSTVIVSQYSNAGFDAFNTGSPPSVSASNGKGDPNEYQTFQGGGVYQSLGGSFGHDYIVEGGQTVTVTITPSVNASGDGCQRRVRTVGSPDRGGTRA